MRVLSSVLVLLFLPTSVFAAAHLLAWDAHNLTSADVSFRLERCVNTGPPLNCAMQFVTNLPRTTTQYLDQGLRKQTRYCYQVKSTTSPFSNVVCTP